MIRNFALNPEEYMEQVKYLGNEKVTWAHVTRLHVWRAWTTAEELAKLVTKELYLNQERFTHTRIMTLSHTE